MKKIASILLALALALSLACAAADEVYEVPRPEGGEKFETNWAIFGMTVEIIYEEAGYRVSITATDPYDRTGTEWEYSCAYNEEQDALLSISSTKSPCAVDPATGSIELQEPEYQGFDDEETTTVFTINENGELTWKDGRGDAGADLVFTNIGDFKGFWCSEDGNVSADIAWSDSEIGYEYGYDVYLVEGEEENSLHGLYDPKTGKLTVTDMEGTEAVFSDLGGGKILLEKDGGIELIFDMLGGPEG